MKICFWCDLHLPSDKNVLQYDVLEWAIKNVTENKADVVAFAGDVTCDGNEIVYKEFLKKINNLPMPVLFIPGNSDLRDEKSAKKLHSMASQCKNSFDNINVYALNDADRTITSDELKEVDKADEKSVVFMHHPIDSLLGESKNKMLEWRKNHPDTMLFYAHCHIFDVNGVNVSLQAMDPDKSIGESPCITYYDTKSGEISKSRYSCDVPADLFNFFGISCYKAVEDIKYATDKKLKAIELRPGFLSVDTDEVKKLIENWRKSGGENLSIHLPDIAYVNGEVVSDKNLEKYIEAANAFGVDRLTQHVPKVSVKETLEDGEVLDKIAKHLGQMLDRIDHDVVVGIENMHMTASEKADESRRFGYIPGECLEFMELLSKNCRHEVGINFDIGHARNNSPFSQKYQTGTWLSMLGKHIIGYHIHQVTLDEHGFHNHCGIDDVYGRLISYASFFKYWSNGVINKAPFVFEMGAEGAYDITLAAFEKHRHA